MQMEQAKVGDKVVFAYDYTVPTVNWKVRAGTNALVLYDTGNAYVVEIANEKGKIARTVRDRDCLHIVERAAAE